MTISIAGTSTTQKSYMGVFITNYGTDRATNTVYGAGTFMDSYRLGANQRIGRGISNQATADTGSGSAIYGDTGQYQVYVPDKVVPPGAAAAITTTRASRAARAISTPAPRRTGRRSTRRRPIRRPSPTTR